MNYPDYYAYPIILTEVQQGDAYRCEIPDFEVFFMASDVEDACEGAEGILISEIMDREVFGEMPTASDLSDLPLKEGETVCVVRVSMAGRRGGDGEPVSAECFTEVWLADWIYEAAVKYGLDISAVLEEELLELLPDPYGPRYF